jgi:tetratricopeptide (TPR) repeat protein
LRCFGTSALGYDLLGRVSARQKTYSEAILSFAKAVELNPRDPRAKNHLLLAVYAGGDKKTALDMARRYILERPLDLTPRSLIALQSGDQMDAFVGHIRASVGEPVFALIESSVLFYGLGLTDEAENLLLETCVHSVPEKLRNPLPFYYLAYFTADFSRRSLDYLRQAAGTSRDFVFPSRTEALDVLKYAVAKNPEDAFAYQHLGNLYADLGRLDAAVGQWSKATELDPGPSISWRNLGLYQWEIKKNFDKAAGLYKKAIAAEPADQTLYRDLARIFMADEKHREAIDLINSMKFSIQRRGDIDLSLAECYLHEQRYTEAIRLLEETIFIPWEGQTTPWDLYNEACIERGREFFEKKKYRKALLDFEKALTYPENLHVGRASWSEEASAQYWKGRALMALERPDEARTAWREGASGVAGSERQNEYRRLCEEALE